MIKKQSLQERRGPEVRSKEKPSVVQEGSRSTVTAGRTLRASACLTGMSIELSSSLPAPNRPCSPGRPACTLGEARQAQTGKPSQLLSPPRVAKVPLRQQQRQRPFHANLTPTIEDPKKTKAGKRSVSVHTFHFYRGGPPIVATDVHARERESERS